MAEAPAHTFITAMEDSRRWRGVRRRPGDIVISTPPKSGTTLTQGIVASLLWPSGDAPGSTSSLSPWVDAMLTPLQDLVDKLEGQAHRRFVKTHSPGDCIPFDARCSYIVVYRDGRDALVSWGNHRATMRPEVVRAMNLSSSGLDVDPLDEVWNGDYDTLFDEWEVACSSVRHLASWWPRRHAANVLFVHYNDLRSDLSSEMRRIATFLGIEVGEELWPMMVERCGLDQMRAKAEALGGMEHGFDGGASAFFFKGTNGRWKDLLSQAQVDRYLALVDEGLSPQAAEWLEQGSLEVGARPSEMGEAPEAVAMAPRNPMVGRLREQTSNSVHAISERRVDEAREDGLFDDLPLHGKPIPDLDRQRRPGWWAERFVASERNKVTALQLEAELRAAMPSLWRLGTEQEVDDRLVELNAKIAAYNAVTTLAPMSALDLDETLMTWRRMKDR